MKRGHTWSYVIRVRDPEIGVSRPKWVGGFATEEDAKAARDEARVKARRGEYIDRNAVTVGKYLDEWIEAHAVEIKPKTLRDYRLSDRPARQAAYRRASCPGGEAGADHEAVPGSGEHPVERAKRPRKQQRELGKVWTPAQLRVFLEVARQHRLFAFFHVAAYTGARRGELLYLRWRDVDLDRAEIRIAGSASVIGGERVEGTTKSGRSRVVSIDAETVRVLQEHRATQAQERLTVGPEWRGSDDYVFTSAWGEPVHPDTVSSLMSTLIKAYNAPKNAERPQEPLPHARLHDLRHIHAMTLLLAGVPVHVVAARLGHADPSITLRVYAHVVNEQLAAAADIFAQAVTDAG